MKRATIASLVLVLSFLFSMFPVSFAQSTTDWPMFQHDPAHTGYAASSTSTGQPPGTLIWNQTFSALENSFAVADGIIYTGLGQNVYALNAYTGAQLWNYNTGIYSWGFSSPVVADGLVYIVSANGNFYAFNAYTGALVWSYAATSGFPVLSSPAIANGIAYGSYYNELFALKAIDGTLIWNFTTGGVEISAPTVVNGVVYIGAGDGNIYALNAYSGTIIWNYTTTSEQVGAPAVVGGVVYLASWGVCALDASTGALLWSYTTGGGSSCPAVVDGVVYIGSLDNNIYALDAYTGALVWRYSTGGPVLSSPAVANGVVYVGTWEEGKIYAFNAIDGRLIWSYQTGGGIASSPAVANGIAYIGSDDNKLYAFSAFTSKPTFGFFNGFEEGFNSWTTNYGRVSVVSSPVYQGGSAMKCSDPWGSLAAKTIGQQSETYTSAEFLFDKNVAGDQTLMGYRNWAGNPTAALGISVESGRIFVFVQTVLPSYSYRQYELTGFFTSGTWYKFALDVSSNSASIYVNDKQVASLSQANIPATDSVNVGMFWGNGAYAGNLYVDNVQISNPQI